MRTLIAATLLVVAAPVAFAQTMHGGVVMVSATEKGKILTDSHGMTLYTYDHDSRACPTATMSVLSAGHP
ncbi:hypothetical protein GCM10023174_25920 [Chelativorans composti]|uniref:Uncharacterized protein n=1 Tax=Chelativorans composti TaxID=768533 RepID=A0ABW5DKT5_9HYPH